MDIVRAMNPRVGFKTLPPVFSFVAIVALHLATAPARGASSKDELAVTASPVPRPTVSPAESSASSTPFDLASLQEKADKGDAGAQFDLGRAYMGGDGVPRDLKKAFELFKASAAQGNMKAENNLGYMYAGGGGVTRDLKAAVDWYRKAAEQGGALAEDNLGLMLAHGFGAPKDCKQAADWYRKAAEQDFLDAEVHLGMLDYFGDTGFPQNYSEALVWLTKAAGHNNAQAQNAVGVMYQYGYGVPVDLTRALHYFQLAADQGDPKAQSNLGQMYMAGHGVPQDNVKAYQWLIVARQRGEITAAKMLVGLEPTLTEQEKEEGKKLADDWKPGAAQSK